MKAETIGFSPLAGIKFAERGKAGIQDTLASLVSVPLRGLSSRKVYTNSAPLGKVSVVSVPLRGLSSRKVQPQPYPMPRLSAVSVPLRGLSSRKVSAYIKKVALQQQAFQSPCGD